MRECPGLRIFATIMVLLLAYGGFFALGYYLDHDYKVYEGQEILTQDELDEFRIYLFDSKASIRSFDTTDLGDGRMFVSFEVKLYDADSPYGVAHYDKGSRIVYPCVIGSFLSIYLSALIWSEDIF